MLSISSYPLIRNTNYIASKHFQGGDIGDLVSQGDRALNENRYEDALKVYQQANQRDPQNNKVYKKLGKVYFHLKDYTKSEKEYRTYLENVPNDAEGWIELGETQRNAGFYQKAIESFQQASKLDKSNDLAKRSIMEAKNNMLAIFSPAQAKKEKTEYAQKNLRKALQMTIDYMSPEYMQDLENVQVTFGETASMGGTPNIAQYENYKNTITVSNSYIYAAPQVIAAYLTHESVHAHDNDPYTSVHEEQDAYETATKFWIYNSNGVKDPEMDYAASLYEHSPQTLRNRVEEIYRLRDPGIAKTSPNHPPTRLFHWGISNEKAASQSIKKYDVIA